MRQAAADLGLPDLGDHQDWGIEFADPKRLPEFVAYYREHQAAFGEWAQEYYLGELLLESANDALRDGGQPHSLIEEAVSLIAARRESKATQFLIDCWIKLGSSGLVEGETEFPIAAVFRQALGL